MDQVKPKSQVSSYHHHQILIHQILEYLLNLVTPSNKQIPQSALVRLEPTSSHSLALYMSPESISGNKYDNKTDIWSLGITVIEMIECKLPFEGMNIMQAIGAIVNDPPPTLSNPGKYSPELNNFIAECLTKDTTKRKSAFELLMVKKYRKFR